MAAQDQEKLKRLLELETRLRSGSCLGEAYFKVLDQVAAIHRSFDPAGKNQRCFQRIPADLVVEFRHNNTMKEAKASDFSLGGFSIAFAGEGQSPMRRIQLLKVHHGNELFELDVWCESVQSLEWQEEREGAAWLGMRFLFDDKVAKEQVYRVFDHIYLTYLRLLAEGP